VKEFLKYIEEEGIFPKKLNAFHVAKILEKMELANMLQFCGYSKELPDYIGLNKIYTNTPYHWNVRRGKFQFVSVLGPEYLRNLCSHGLVQIIGTDKKVDEISGTGLVIHPFFVLTCRHVICGMNICQIQKFQGKACKVEENLIHKNRDIGIAVIGVTGAKLDPLKGMFFQPPVVAQTVYSLGYPKLPNFVDASIVIQSGAVTNESVKSLSGESMFPYSAIARLGNSGGVIMSDDGYVVGLSTVDSTGKYNAGEVFSPHYAGIPAQVVVKAVADLDLGLSLTLADYE